MTTHIFADATTLPSMQYPKRVWSGLNGAASALAIAQAAEQHESAPTVVITDNVQRCYTLERALSFFLPEHPVNVFPDWETLPYDSFSPHHDIVSARISLLHHLCTDGRGIIILPTTTLAHRLCPKSFITQRTFFLRQGNQLDENQFRQQLITSGYRKVEQVMTHGEFALRGSMIDLFPMGAKTPYRIDLDDDSIDSIRCFEPETQRTITKTDQIRLLPAHEFPTDSEATKQFRLAWRESFDVPVQDCAVYQDVSQGIMPPGCEYYLPLFFDETACFFDYTPKDTLFFLIGDIEANLTTFWTETRARYEQYRHDIKRPLLSPDKLFISTDAIFQSLKNHSRVVLSSNNEHQHAIDHQCPPAPDLRVDHKSKRVLWRLAEFLDNTSLRCLLCAESNGRREVLIQLLNQSSLTVTVVEDWLSFLTCETAICITVGQIEHSMIVPHSNFCLIAEQDLFSEQVLQRRRRKISGKRYDDAQIAVKNLAELQHGAPVVHIEHGIGRYLGLKHLQINGVESEYLHLAYAKQSNLYVPVASLHLISRYAGTETDNAPLDALGSGQWEKTKRKAQQQIKDVAVELLQIYARRRARIGHAFQLDTTAYERFCASFPFEETPDQEKAISDVLNDLSNKQPTDRLICGDVGFGKTEVAMRAAFVVAFSGKQVAVLVPTTLLAQQHYQTFTDRFADWPIKIHVLSRFNQASAQAAVIDDCQTGKADIIIGTHKLLGKNVRFADLGLLIIDEEHRFGVSQKERLKQLRTEVDIITMTATPIPRTLNMALSGMRDLSIITTPPQRRLAIKTFVREYQTTLVREALNREIYRGGQVYYLYNDVKRIHIMAEELAQLVPEARVAVGHGQMPERTLERVMGDFYHQRFNILVCTTIIETGIDIPSANTIIIHRADKFGLAQLHQLRGRVGRSHHQAYAYLLTPPKKQMTADALKRLDAISMLEELGSGFNLASHDLEIRGAGELLGEEQSGNIHSIGITLYMEMLEAAVETLKAGKALDDNALEKTSTVEIDLKTAALIPNDYVPDAHTRLVLYKRISHCDTYDALDELKVELIDRFGCLPEQTIHLFWITHIKLKAQHTGIKKLDANASGCCIEFDDNAHIDPEKIVQLIQEKPQTYQLEGPKKLRYRQSLPSVKDRFDASNQLLQILRQDTNA